MTWTERRTRRRLGRGWIAVLLALVLVAGACGDDDDGGASSGDGSAAADGSGSEDGSDDGAAVDSGADGSADAGGAEDGGADDGATDGSSDDGEAVTPTPGGSATFLVFSEITSFDPIQMTGAGSADGNRALAVYDQLLRLDNATGEIAPHIAESFEPNEDYSVWTLKIRPGVLFSDGTPYDAAAVKFNWEYMRDTEGSRSAASTANMVELNVIDDLTLEIVLERPDAALDFLVARRIYWIGSPTAIEERGEDFGISPVGAGPFMVKEWIRDDRLILERNPNYWQADQGLPYLDELTMRVVNDTEQRWNTFDQGEAELMYFTDGSSAGNVDDGGYSYAQVVSEGGPDINLNTQAPPFDDPEVRRAFVMSVDQFTLNDIVQNGNLVPAVGLFSEESPFASTDIEWTTFDCEAAKTKWGELAEANGGPIEFVIGAFQGDSAQVAEFMQASIVQCSDGNVNVEVDVAESGTAIARNFTHDFQAHIWGIEIYVDPLDQLNSNLRCGSPQNSTQYCNEAFDAVLDEAAGLPVAERGEVWIEAQRILAEDNPVMFYQRSVIRVAYQPAVHGVEVHTDGLLSTELVWVEQ